jgi:hypothetical protein
LPHPICRSRKGLVCIQRKIRTRSTVTRSICTAGCTPTMTPGLNSATYPPFSASPHPPSGLLENQCSKPLASAAEFSGFFGFTAAYSRSALRLDARCFFENCQNASSGDAVGHEREKQAQPLLWSQFQLEFRIGFLISGQSSIRCH